MKHIRKFYEELKPSTYRSAAAGKLNKHGDVEAAKRLRDWAKKVEGGAYNIAYVCAKDNSEALYWGSEYTATMTSPRVVGVYYGTVTSGSRSKDDMLKDTAQDLIERWASGGSLSVSMVVQFKKTEERRMVWVYEVTVAGQKIGEAGEQTQRFELDANDEKAAKEKLNQLIKSAYPKIIGKPLDSDVVSVRLVQRPNLGMTDELMAKAAGVGWLSSFGSYMEYLDTFIIEVRLSNSTYGMREAYACHACGGAVTMDCYECDGEGEVWNDEADDTVPCTVCNGTGTHTCEECEGRDLTEGKTRMNFFEDTFMPEVFIRAIPGKTEGVNNTTAYSRYPWIGMFETREDARRFLANEWPRLIEEAPSRGHGTGRNSGSGVSLYETVVDLVKELVDVNKSEDAMGYAENAVKAMENISVAAIVIDRNNRAKMAASSLTSNRNISTYKK